MILNNSDKTKYEHFVVFQGNEYIEKELSGLAVKYLISESLKKKISIRAFTDIYRYLNNNDIDIIHTHLIKPYSIAGLVNILLRKKLIFNYHGIFLKNNPYYNIFEKSIYRIIQYLINNFSKTDVVLVPSEKSRQLLREETKLFPEPLVYYNGYPLKPDLPKANPIIAQQLEELRKYKHIIAVIGRLEIDKRIDQAVLLIKNLVDKKLKVHLIVFGDGSLLEELNQLIKKYQLIDSVEMFGYVKDIENYFKYLDVVLFTSDWEGMPLTMWESMANGVPIVAPNVGGFKEIIEANNCGFIYEPNDLKEAENKILELIKDESKRKYLGQNGKSVIEKKYNNKEFIKQIENIYSKLMSE